MHLHTLLFAFLPFLGLSQTPIGSWEAHYPMSSFKWVGETKDYYYAANYFGVLSVDRTESSAAPLTKVNKLSQSRITSFACSYDLDLCIVGYENGNIDFIDGNNQVTNQPAIMNSQAIGDKSVRDIYFEEGHAFLATGVGILQLDLESGNVLEYTPISYEGKDQKIMTIHRHGSQTFFTTESHLLSTDNQTLFNSPSPNSIAINCPVSEINDFFELNNALHFIQKTPKFKNDTVHKITSTIAAPITTWAGRGIRSVFVGTEELIVSHATSIEVYNMSMDPSLIIFTYNPGNGLDGMNPQACIPTHDQKHLLVADDLFGLIKIKNRDQYNTDIHAISSPAPQSSNIQLVQKISGDIYALPGGNEYTYNRPNVHRFRDRTWNSKELVSEEFPTYVNGNSVVSIADELYFGSDRGGLMVTNEDLELLVHYTDENSPLDDLHEGYEYFGVSGMASDLNGNLVMTHTKDAQPLKFFHPGDETWTEISFAENQLNSPKASDILVLNNGYILQTIIDVGILVYDQNGTPKNTADDRHRLLTASPTEGNLPSSQVTCMMQDRNGEVWIGTNEGIGVIYAPEAIFNAGFSGASRIIVTQDGYGGYLFGTETVEVIRADGADRKWVGTFNSGLFLISADGQEQLAHFTPENSPLLDEKITDIAILPSTGEVFVAAGGALVSYRSTATEPSSTLGDVRVFPNPVQPGFNGVVAIANLSEEAVVRITDGAGNLYFEGISTGGQFTWDRHDLRGQPVSPGTYLVHISSKNGGVGTTTKLLIR